MVAIEFEIYGRCSRSIRMAGAYDGPPVRQRYHYAISFVNPQAAYRLRAMTIEIQTEREGDRARLVPAGPFDLAHAAIKLRFTGTDRVVRTQLVRDSEPVSGGLPGDLSIAAGRLLGRLASEASKTHRRGRGPLTIQSSGSATAFGRSPGMLEISVIPGGIEAPHQISARQIAARLAKSAGTSVAESALDSRAFV
jgi:hypothetical protein